MPLAPEYFTADMVRAIPDDGKRYELVWGELLVTPAPRLAHQAIVSNAMFALISYCRRHRCGRVFTSPADISWSPDTLVQPDVFVVSPKEAKGREWSGGPRSERVTWHPAGAEEPLVIELAELLSDT